MSLNGAEKYRREESPPRRPGDDLIARAMQVPIQSVLRDLFGLHVPFDLDRSWKTNCPFAFEHPDGGIDKNFRVYPSNSAYCFAMHGGLNPVRIVMIQRDLPAKKAAQHLADRYGLIGQEPYWKKMQRLVLESENERAGGGSPQHAVEAMQSALARLEGFTARQYDEDVLAVIEDRLEKLDLVIRSGVDGAVRSWLSETVDAVRSTL